MVEVVDMVEVTVAVEYCVVVLTNVVSTDILEVLKPKKLSFGFG